MAKLRKIPKTGGRMWIKPSKSAKHPKYKGMKYVPKISHRSKSGRKLYYHYYEKKK